MGQQSTPNKGGLNDFSLGIAQPVSARAQPTPRCLDVERPLQPRRNESVPVVTLLFNHPSACDVYGHCPGPCLTFTHTFNTACPQSMGGMRGVPLPALEYMDIPYVTAKTRSPLHEFDLYVPHREQSARPPPLICFIHGGAWRSEDKAEHAGLARRLAARTNFPVAVPNYRLTTASTPTRHPTHAEDVLAFLHFILSWPGPHTYAHGPPYDPTQLYFIGHSCSAHMLTSIFLQVPNPGLDLAIAAMSSPSTPPRTPSPPPSLVPTPDTLLPSPVLLAATRAVIMSEGLYDLDALLVTYPAYKTWFIAPTFGRLRSYAPWNTASYAFRPGGEHLRWLILHSEDDTLVDQDQSERIWNHLKRLYREERGDTDGSMVRRNWADLTEEHNDMLTGEVYPSIVGDFILNDVQRRESPDQCQW